MKKLIIIKDGEIIKTDNPSEELRKELSKNIYENIVLIYTGYDDQFGNPIYTDDYAVTDNLKLYHITKQEGMYPMIGEVNSYEGQHKLEDYHDKIKVIGNSNYNLIK